MHKVNRYLGLAALVVVTLIAGSAFAKSEKGAASMSTVSQGHDKQSIYFAGGCFWGVEAYFARVKGVLSTSVGYANGDTKNPSYEDVTQNDSGHAETVELVYDPKVIGLEDLIDRLFTIIDPVSINRQGFDSGVQYRTGIYYTNEDDAAIIARVMERLQKKYTEPLAVQTLPLDQYFLAEDYHQEYLQKNPAGYCHINLNNFKDELMPATPYIDPAKYTKPSADEIASRLDKNAFAITQDASTEPAFSGTYVDTKERGVYVDIVTGEPLFLSSAKFDSGSGWPSFTKPIADEVIVEKKDTAFGMARTEVASRVAGSHLGHVFDDGPKDQGGLRYCINSAALRFVPYEDMDDAGYSFLKKFLYE